jgi:hypothetical protein
MGLFSSFSLFFLEIANLTVMIEGWWMAFEKICDRKVKRNS